jgi:hypothetical protein
VTESIVTIFKNKVGARINASRPMDLAEVERIILATKPVTEKDKLALLKFAQFGDRWNVDDDGKKTSLRHDGNVDAVTGLEGDYDGEQMPMEAAADILRNAGIESMLYTSARHTPEKPRWRVLCPLSAPLTGDMQQLKERRSHHVGVLNAVLGGVLTIESFTLAQGFYFGRLTGKPDPAFVRLEGVCIDQMANPPAPRFCKVKEQKANGDEIGEEKHEYGYVPLRALSVRVAGPGVTAKHIEAVLHVELDGYPEGANIGHTDMPTLRSRVAKLAASAAKKYAKSQALSKSEQASIIEQVNAEHALILVTGKLYVMWKERMRWGDTNFPLLSTIDDVRKIWSNRIAGPKNPIDEWLGSLNRHEYGGIVFQPGVTDTGRYYNLFSGWGIEPVQGDCGLFLSHLRKVVCNGDENLYQYYIQWLANIVQQPLNKPGTAIAMGGIQGAGKGIIVRYLRPILNPYLVQLSGGDQLLGRFNDLFAGKLLIFGDEMVWPGDKKGTDKLKAYITEERIVVERKNQPAIEIDNHARIITSTNREHTAPAEINDRRYVPVPVPPTKVGDRTYWKALEEERLGAGPAALLYHLLHEVTITRELRDNPKTDALAQQKLLNLDNVGQFWRAMLMDNEHELTEGFGQDKRTTYWKFDEFIRTTVLYEFFVDFTRRHRISHIEPFDAFGRKLRVYVQLVKREARSEELRQLGLKPGERAKVYPLPSLEDARLQFQAQVGGVVDWHEPHAPRQEMDA